MCFHLEEKLRVCKDCLSKSYGQNLERLTFVKVNNISTNIRANTSFTNWETCGRAFASVRVVVDLNSGRVMPKTIQV